MTGQPEQLPHTLTVTFGSDGSGDLWPTYQVVCPYDLDDYTAARPCRIYATEEPDEDGDRTYQSGCWVQECLDAGGMEAICIKNVPQGTTSPILLVVSGWGDYPTLSYVAAVDSEAER